MTARLSLVALAIGAFGLGMNEFVMLGLLPEVATSLDVSIPVAGYLISAYALGVVLGAPLLTLALRIRSPKSGLMLLMGLFVLSNVLTALLPSFDLVFVARLLAGLPHGAFFGIGALLASRLAAEGKQAQAMSIMFLGLTVANVVGVPLGTFLGQHLDWRLTFGVVALIGLLALVSLHLWVPRMPPVLGRSVLDELKVFRRREVWLLIFTTICGSASLFATFSYIAPLMIQVTGLDSRTVPLVLVLAGLGFTAGNLIGGRLADRSPIRSMAGLLVALAVISGVLWLVLPVPAAAVASVFVFSVIAFALVNPAQLLLIRTAVGAEGLGSAASQAAFNAGNALGAYLGGLPIAAGLGYRAPPLVGAALALVGVGLALTAGRQLHRQRSPEPALVDV